MLKFIVKWSALLLIAYIFIHAFTAGQDEIIEGPPETPDTSLYMPTETP
jgi:hypothetical protein